MTTRKKISINYKRKRTMKTIKAIAAMLLVSISSTITFTSCQQDSFEESKEFKATTDPTAGTGMQKAYGLTYQNFINNNDVTILNADTTEISVNKALAEKLGIVSFKGHAMGIWDCQSHLPYARKATEERLVGDRYILKVVPATMAELIGDQEVKLNTAGFFNPNVQGSQTRAGMDMPEYAAKYIDENDIIHPAMVYLTDEYGYEKDYYTDDDKPKAITRANGEYQFITGEDLAKGSRASLDKNILSLHSKMEQTVKLPCGKSGGDNAKITFKAPVDFELNYFFTINTKFSWFKLKVQECETGLSGKFAISPEVTFDMHKKWELPADKFTAKIANFPGYTFCFMIGIIPVVVRVNPNMYARVDGKVTADFKAGFKYEYACNFKGGVRYANGNWGVIKEMKEEKNTFTFNKPTAEVHAETGVGFYIGVEVLFYGLAGPTASVGPRLGATADLKAVAGQGLDLKAKADLSINAEAGAKLKLLGFELAEYHENFKLGGPWKIWEYSAKVN
jgi:hypothetical protein